MQEIISCSRRTDIPAFYYEWLQESLKNGYVFVKNPYSQKSYLVDLTPQNVHSICLWSKSFSNVLRDPGLLSLYNLYFQFAVTGYSKVLEPSVIDTKAALKQMERLAYEYSPQQVNWRFDPVIISNNGEGQPAVQSPDSKRLDVFEGLCRDISSFGIKRCTVSFLSLYKKVERKFKDEGFCFLNPSDQEKSGFAEKLAEISDKYGITIYSCADPVIEKVPGIVKGHCIDGPYLEKLFGKKASHAKDNGQREGCGCTKSKDIGAYEGQSCGHGCLYCYAN